MKAKILKMKNEKGFHGMILSGTLFRTGPEIVPQLFPFDWKRSDIQKSIRHIDIPFVNSLDDFDLVNVEIKEI